MAYIGVPDCEGYRKEVARMARLTDAPTGSRARDIDTGATYYREADGWWRRHGAEAGTVASVNSAYLSGFHVEVEYPEEQ
jgi:hypothetical protein